MRARTAADIRQLALARGAEAEIGGSIFNSSHERVAVKAAKAANEETPAPPPPPPAPSLSQEDVVRIAAEMLADSERRTAQALADQASALTLAIAKALRESAAPPGRVLLRQKVKVAYDDEDRITEMTVTPIYKD